MCTRTCGLIVTAVFASMGLVFHIAVLSLMLTAYASNERSMRNEIEPINLFMLVVFIPNKVATLAVQLAYAIVKSLAVLKANCIVYISSAVIELLLCIIWIINFDPECSPHGPCIEIFIWAFLLLAIPMKITVNAISTWNMVKMYQEEKAKDKQTQPQ